MPVTLDSQGRLPQLTVEVDKTNLPTNPVRVWTEITGYLRHIGGSRSGRNDEFQRTTPGTLQLTVNNRDDAGVRFETLGVKKAQWIRVRAVWQGTTYNLWQGVIEGLLRQWPSSGKDATLELTATDSFKLCRLYDLAGETFPAQRVDQRITEILALVGFPVFPGYSNAILGFVPSLYWRLDESAGTVAADLSNNGRPGTYGAGITLSQTGALVGDADTAVSFNDTITAEVQSAYQPFTLLSKRTFMGWAKRTATTTIDTLFGQASNASPPIGASLQIQAASNLVAWSTGLSSCSWTNAWPGTGTYVHWALTYDDTTQTVELFINGVSQGPIVITAGYNTGIVPNTLVLGCRFNANVYIDPWNGAIDEFAVFERVLSARDITTIYQMGLIAATGTFDTDTDPCDAVVTPLSTNSDALSQLLALEGSDNGLLIANGDGSMAYQGRHWRMLNASTATVKLADDFTGIPYRDTAQYQDDDSRIANVVNVTPLGGSAITARDSTSQLKYFSRVNPSADRSLLSSSTSLAASAGQWLLNKYKDPSPRIPTIVIDMMAAQKASNTYVASLLAAVNSQRWNWKRTTASPVNQDTYIEQVAFDIDPRVPAWITTLNLSPADVESWWILGDATYGILGSTTKVAY